MIQNILNIKFSQRWLLVITLIITCLVICTLAYVGRQWHQDWQLTHQAPKISNIAAPKDDSISLIAALPEAHLFGKSFSKVGEVPTTNLQLQVTGIVKIGNESGGYSKAYISMAGQPGKIFHIGDNLPYGVKVYDITKDAVILENDGNLEKLLLPREKLVFKPRLEQSHEARA